MIKSIETTGGCFLLAIMTLALFVCCEKNSAILSEKLDEVKSLLYVNRVEEAANILDSVSYEVRSCGKSLLMKYDMLYVQAKNKAYKSISDEKERMEQVVEYYSKNGTADEKMESCLLLGSVYRDIGDAPMALEWFEKAIQHGNDGADDRIMIAKIHGQKADLFYKQRMTEDAMLETDRAISIAEREGNRSLYVNGMAFKTKIYYQMHNLDSVKAVTEDVYDILLNEFNDTVQAVVALSPLFTIYVDSGMVSQAKPLIEKYEKHSGYFDEEGNVIEGKEVHYVVKGDICRHEGDMEMAEHYYRRGTKAKDLANKYAAYNGLLKLFIAKMENDSITKYSMLTNVALKQYFDEAHTLNLQQMNSVFSYQHHKDEKEKQERKAANAVNLLMIVVMCVIIVCIASMTMWLKWKWKKKAELIEAQKKIEEAKSEAYQSLLEMNEAKTQLDVHLKEMGRLEDRIRMIEKGSNTETEEIKASQLKLEEKRGVTESLRGEIEKLESYYNQELSGESANILKVFMNKIIMSDDNYRITYDEWCKLEEYVSNAYPSFISNLEKEVENLSKEQRHVSLLVMLGIKPSHIAKIMDKEKSTISQIRKRIYEKAFDKKVSSTEADEWIRSLGETK
jgi:tetratricopeptide (TPR) repeat protein